MFLLTATAHMYFPATSNDPIYQIFQDEMCFGLMNYYPKEMNLKYCISYKGMDACEVSDWSEKPKTTNSAANNLISSALLLTGFLFLF